MGTTAQTARTAPNPSVSLVFVTWWLVAVSRFSCSQLESLVRSRDYYYRSTGGKHVCDRAPLFRSAKSPNQHSRQATARLRFGAYLARIHDKLADITRIQY